MKDILNDFSKIRVVIDEEFKAAFGAIRMIEADIGVALHGLDILLTPLRDLNALWHKKFSVKFPYPDPDWKHPFRIRHFTLRVGFSVIIKGVHEIEREIKRLLKEALYEAAKVFGLKKLAEELVHEAERELRAIQAAYDKIKQQLEADIQPFIDAMNTLKQDEKALEKIYADCKKAL